MVQNMLFAEERIGLRTRDRKYVRWEGGKEEIYDLVADPREQRDLAGDPSVIGPLRGLYVALVPPLTPSVTPGPPTATDLTTELRALGYVH
jgi:hypothetical protein